jgi:AP-2 complex subunit alpha
MLTVCSLQEYMYYTLANPWLQVKLIRFLRYFPPPENPQVRQTLIDTLVRILDFADKNHNAAGTTASYKNALLAVLFEATDLITFSGMYA